MSSLAGTTEKLRSLMKIGAIIAGGLFLLYIFIMIGIFVKNIFFPTAPDAPVQEFGQLPSLEFNSQGSNLNFLINTISGELPMDLPDRMMVYKLSSAKPDLLALQNARSIASIGGFKDSETKISDTVYQWTNPTTGSVLQYDIHTKDFEIRSNYLSNQALIQNPTFPDETRIKEDVSEYLSAMGVSLDNLTFKDDSVIYYAIAGSTLQGVDNIFNAKVVRVSLYNNNIVNDLGDFSFVYPNNSIINLVVSYPSSFRMIVLEGDAYSHEILAEEFSDYPIKSAAEAFEELKAGRGYVINPTNQTSIQITSVYLAYYLDKNTTAFAQPVFVFEGPDAKAYVAAVRETNQLTPTGSE